MLCAGDEERGGMMGGSEAAPGTAATMGEDGGGNSGSLDTGTAPGESVSPGPTPMEASAGSGPAVDHEQTLIAAYAKLQTLQGQRRRGSARSELVPLWMNDGVLRKYMDAAKDFQLVQAANGLEYEDEEEYVRMIQEWLDRGAFVDSTDEEGYSPLILAAMNDSVEATRLLIERGANVDWQSREGATALMNASINGNQELVKLLLDAGAGVNLQDCRGFTALVWAGDYENDAVFEMLLEHGADLDLPDGQNSTALMRAAAFNHVSAVRMLLRRNAKTWLTDSLGFTALMYGAIEGHDQVVQALLEGALNGPGGRQVMLRMVNIGNNEGNTALMEAANFGHEKVVQMILDHGGDYRCVNKRGESAVDLARASGKRGVVRILIKAMVDDAERRQASAAAAKSAASADSASGAAAAPKSNS
ncbi:Kinase D-interacting substrate [Porphyridium purpureum]|uniref:Kinase D-interacting substrate n=1 Tax=Porphyridium purpureum TaxID=35688 RepID=A0A5J4YRJ4_PORPP|nr:Kinase D-interacting substrate [Porphyridium purpureum]|eukprot:POR9215..scf296_7